MGIYSRYSTTLLILLLTFVTVSQAQAAKLHPVPGIARALAAGPSGVMPSGLTVQRSQQLGVMLLKSQVNLSLGGGTIVPVTRGASLSVGGLARGAVTVLKNSSPPKIIGSVVIAGAIASIPGSQVIEGQLMRRDPSTGTTYWTTSIDGSGQRYSGLNDGCLQAYPRPPSQYQRSVQATADTNKFICVIGSVSGFDQLGPIFRHRDTTDSPLLPFGPLDWDALEGAIPSSDPSPSDVTDFWFNLCGGVGACMGSYTSDPTLSGPPSVQGPQTTTTSTRPNGTTTTTKDTQHDLDYSNPDGVVVRDRTTTTKQDPDGTTTTDTTQDTGPVTPADPFVTPGSGVSPDPDFDGTFSDTPFPDIEPFYQQKYPDGLQGAWNTRKAEFEDSAFMGFLSSFIPSFSGSCPGWSMNINIASWASFGIHEFQSLCWVFDFIKVVLLVSAAFLCRALIFGG